MKKFLKSLLSMFNFRHESATKIISILLAVLFWIFVMDKENPVITRVFYNVPVSYAGSVDSELVISSAPKYYANVEISGRRNSVLAVRSDYLSLSIDLSKLVEGTNNAEIDISSTFNDVTVVGISPSNAAVVLEKVISAAKPVNYYLTAPFDETLSTSVVKVNPTQVVVSGPRSLVSRVVELVGYIDASEISESKTFELLVTPIDSMGEAVNGVSTSGNTVTAMISAVRTKTVPVKVDYTDETDEGYELHEFKLDATEAKISGDPQYVDSVSELRASPVAVTGNENVAGRLVFDYSQNITIHNEETLTYSAEVLKIENSDLSYDVSEVAIVGLAENLTAKLQEGFNITITLRGIAPAISGIKKSDFSLSVDLSGYDAGTHTVELRIEPAQNLITENTKFTYELTAGSPINVQIDSGKGEGE